MTEHHTIGTEKVPASGQTMPGFATKTGWRAGSGARRALVSAEERERLRDGEIREDGFSAPQTARVDVTVAIHPLLWNGHRVEQIIDRYTEGLR
jgi:hypothetical protein